MTQEPVAKDWRLADFDFDLPPDRIANAPLAAREQAKLLHVMPDSLADQHVFDLPDLLRPGDLLVMNDTRVIPARLYGQRGAVKVETLLHKRQDQGRWYALARPGKRLRPSDQIVYAADFTARVADKTESGDVLLDFGCDDATLFAQLARYGHVPLPPYIKRENGDTAEDKSNYQTVYARHEGAVAAPTAGLHFTQDLLKQIEARGIGRVTLTLHVGAGTFLPVKADHIRDHVMHAEWGEITPEAAAQINAAKQAGRRIVSIGTTSLRLLETVADPATGLVRPFTGETSIFIYPGYRFKIVDALMTNFHLPKSTLFMLVSAFAGLDKMRTAYAHAVASHYRFFSYGDTCLLEKNDAAAFDLAP